MKHRLPKKVLADIRKAITAAHMTDANFDAATKEKTKLYRETWIVGPLERVMRWSRGIEE